MSVVRTRTAVVLPAPFGPSMPRMVPSATSKSRPASAWVSPKDLWRPTASIIARFIAGKGTRIGVRHRMCRRAPMVTPSEVLMPAWRAGFSRASDIEFRELLEQLPAAAYTTDAEGLITYYNRHALHLWGRAPLL